MIIRYQSLEFYSQKDERLTFMRIEHLRFIDDETLEADQNPISYG